MKRAVVSLRLLLVMFVATMVGFARGQSNNVTFDVTSSPASGVAISYTPADANGGSGGTTEFNVTFARSQGSETFTAPATVNGLSFDHWIVNGTDQPFGQNAVLVSKLLSGTIPLEAVYDHVLTVQSQNPNSDVQVAAAPADVSGLTGGNTAFSLAYASPRTTVTLTAPATEGNNPFLHWTVDGVVETAGQTAIRVPMTANRTAIAVYQSTNVLTVQSQNPSSGVQITDSPADNNGTTSLFTGGALIYNTRTSFTLTAPATAGGNTFDHWTLNQQAQPVGQTTLTATITADETAVAIYKTPSFALTVQSTNPNTGVAVTASPADNAGLTGGNTTFTLNYTSGTQVTLTAPANQGNNPFLHWTLNGQGQPAGQTAVVIPISAATTAVAVYQPTNVLTVQSQNPNARVQIAAAPADNTGASSGSTQFNLIYNTGTSVTLTAPATQGANSFSNWTIGGTAQPAGQVAVTTTLNADTTAVAIYTTPSFPLTVQSQSPASGVAVTASPADTGGLTSGNTQFILNYLNQTTVALTAPAKVGNNPFKFWTVNGITQTPGQTANFTIAGATTAVAVYQPTNVVTVQSQNPASGVAVTATPADNNAATGGNTQFTLVYNTGTAITLTAPATQGANNFSNWTIGGVAQPAGQNAITTTINADTTCVAIYTTPSFALTVGSQNPASGVAVTASPADSAGLTGGNTQFVLNYLNATAVTLTAPATQGNNPFLHWLINGQAQTTGRTITFTITSATNAIAVYQPTNVVTVQSQDPTSGVAITAAPADNNAATGGNTQFTLVYNTGTSITLTAPATQGLSVFSNWTIGGVAQTTGQTAITTTISADTTCVAVYKTPNFALTVQSQNPASGVAVTASPADAAGLTGGNTTFTLSYAAGSNVTLTAPAREGNNPFLHWTVNGVNQPNGTLATTISVTAATTAVAVYQPTNVVTVQSLDPASGVAITAAPADNNAATGGNTQFTLIYNTGTSITLTAPATQGLSVFSNWTVNGVAQTAGATAVTTTISADTTLVAVYKTPNFALTVQSQNPASGVAVTASPADAAGLTGGNTTFTLSYAAGTSVTLTAPAREGNNPFLHWTIGGVAQPAGQVAVTLSVTAATTAVAVYQSTNVVTVQSQDPATGVAITASPADNNAATGGNTQFTLIYNTGTSISLTAPATKNGNTFVNWTIGGVAQTAGQTAITTTISADTTCVAVYKTPNFALTVQSQNPASGVAVTASPADNAGLTSGNTSFTLNYPNNTSVTLTAPAKVGNNPFLHWMVNGVNQPNGQAAVTIPITAATTAVAVYQATNVVTVQSQNPATGVAVTATPTDNNGAKGGNTGFTLVYNTGTSITLTAPATQGANSFANWTINGVAQTAGATSVTTTINADTTLVAVYKIPNFALTVQSQNPGSGVAVTAAPADNAGLTGGNTSFTLNYPNNTSVTLTAPASEGNNPFLHWTVNGVNQTAGATAVTVSITGATTAVAVYQSTNVLTVQSQNPASGVAVTASPADNTGAKGGNTAFTLTYNTGASVTLTAPATQGANSFGNWVINGVAQPAGQVAVTTTINADTTAIAVYKSPNFALTVQSQNPASGVAVTASPADNAGLTGGTTSFTLNYTNLTSVTLTAPAKEGNNPFLHWTVNGVNQTAGATSVTVSVTAATTAVAVYQSTNVLTVQSQNPNSGVSVTASPADNAGLKGGNTQFTLVYNTGASVTLTAPALQSTAVFQNWTINGVAQPAGQTSVTTTIGADTTAVAVYSTPNFTLTVQSQNPASGVTIADAPADQNGIKSGSTSFTLSYSNQTQVTLTAPAAVGNNPFVRWTVNGVNQPVGTTAVTISVTASTTAVAVYQSTNVLTVQSQNPNSGIAVTASPADNGGLKGGNTQFALVYNTGTSVTLNAPATQGAAVFQNWTINGVAQAAGAVSVTTAINADTTAVAVYKTPNFALTVQSQNPASGVAVTASPADVGGLTGGNTTFTLSYPNLASVTLTAPAKEGNNPFLHWTVNGVDQTAGTLTTTISMTAATTAVAVYQSTNVLTVQSLNPTSGVAITASPADNAGLKGGNTQFTLVYNTGAAVTLTAPATKGAANFSNWVINGTAQPTGQVTITTTLNADSTVVAVYSTPNFALTVQSTNPGSGVAVTVTPNDANGANNGTTTFTRSYANLSSVTLTAPAKVGNNPFLHWSVNGANQAAGATSVTISITEATTAIAVYQSTNVLTVQSQNPASGVAVTASPADNNGAKGGNTQFTLVYNTGAAVTLTAPATENAANFSNWIVNGVAQPIGQVTITTTLSADMTAVAVYSTPNFALTVQSTNPISGVAVNVTPNDANGAGNGTTTFTRSYANLSRVTLTAPAKVGNNPFLHWTVNGVDQTAGTTAVTISMTAATTAVAVYQSTNVLTVQSQNPASGVAVTASPADNGGLKGGNTQFTLVYNTGTSVTLTAPATENAANFANWTINGIAQTPGQRTITTTIAADTTVIAVYNTPNFTLTVQSTNPASGVGVTVTPNDVNGAANGTTTFTRSYPHLAQVKLTAPAKVGNNPFLHWTVNGVDQPNGTLTTTVSMTASLTAIAVYQPTNILTVASQNPSSGVAVTASPADNGGLKGGNTQFALIYNTGTSVTLTAPATENAADFANWTINGIAQPAGQRTITTTVSADTTVVAVYNTPNFTLTVQSTNPATGVGVTVTPNDVNGTGNGTTTFTRSYPHLSRVTLTAPAKVGNNPFLHWTVNGVDQPNGTLSTTISMTASLTAIAVYQPTNILTVQSQNPATGVAVTAAPADNGGLKGGTTQFALVYNTGTSVTLTAPATQNAADFQNWTINGVAQTAGLRTVTTTLAGDTTAIAIYKTPNFTLTVQSTDPATGVAVTVAPNDANAAGNGTTAFTRSYANLTQVKLTAPAKVGNNPFLHWTVNGVAQTAGTKTIAISMTGAMTAIAVYQPTNILTVDSQNPGSGVTITSAPADNGGVRSGKTGFTLIYNTGTSVTLTAPATMNAADFANWTLNGVAQPAGKLTLTTTVSADTTAIAVYKTPNFTLTVQSTNPASGTSVTVSPADANGAANGTTTFTRSYANLTKVTLTAVEKVGNNPFLHWTVNGVNQPTGTKTIAISMTAPMTVVAVYQSTNVLTINSLNPTAGVAVTATPADNTGAKGGNTGFALIYNTGTSVALTAPAVSNFNNFGNWIVNGVAQPAGQLTVTVVLNADTTVTANYSTPIYTVATSSAGTHGKVNPSGNVTALRGTNETFTATPSAGYVVDQWTLDGAPVQAGGTTFQINNVTANHTLIVTFKVVTVLHPADTNKDSRIEIGEVTAYGSAWKHGTTWPSGPVPIPQSFVTNAIALWKAGEAYTFDPTQTEPNAWIPIALAPFMKAQAAIQVPTTGTAIQTAKKMSDGSWQISITVTPPTGASAMTLEEQVPAGAQVSAVSDSGFFDTKNHILRWGPFMGAKVHVFTYRIRVANTATLAGEASFDGKLAAIRGATSVGGK